MSSNDPDCDFVRVYKFTLPNAQDAFNTAADYIFYERPRGEGK